MQLQKELEGVTTVAIAGHIRPDGDSVGACIGLWTYINDNFPQVEADMWLEKPDDKFSMLKGFSELRVPDGEEREYDLFIAVDCAALDRLGKAQPAFEKAGKTLCIDHHVSNKGYALTNIIDGDASSACEVICRLLDMEEVSRDAGVFQYSCTSPETMRLAAALMEKQIPYTEILEETFYKKTYLQNQVMGKALLESMRLLNGKCIVSVMRQKDMDFFGVTTTDLDGIVSQMKQTKGVEVAIFLYETDYMEYKVSLRSENIVDVSKVASYFGGGGHVRAAGVTMKGTFHDIVNNLTLHIERQLEGQED